MSYLGPKVHIDLHQLKKNYQLVKNEVGEIPIMATVKANAYGHGAVEVSKALEEEGEVMIETIRGEVVRAPEVGVGAQRDIVKMTVIEDNNAN